MSNNSDRRSTYCVGAKCIFNFDSFRNIPGSIVERGVADSCWWFIPDTSFKIPIGWTIQSFGGDAAIEVHEKYLDVVQEDDDIQADISDFL